MGLPEFSIQPPSDRTLGRHIKSIGRISKPGIESRTGKEGGAWPRGAARHLPGQGLVVSVDNLDGDDHGGAKFSFQRRTSGSSSKIRQLAGPVIPIHMEERVQIPCVIDGPDPEGFEPSTAGLEIRCPIRARRRVRTGDATPRIIIHRPRSRLATTEREPVDSRSRSYPLNPRTPPATFAAFAAFTAERATACTAVW